MKIFLLLFYFIFSTLLAQSPIISFAYSNNGEYLFSGHKDGSVALWNLLESRIEWIKFDQSSPVTSVDVSTEFKDVLIYSNRDGQIVSRDKDGNIYFKKQIIMDGSVNSASLTYGGEYIIASGQDSLVHVLDSITGTLLSYFYQKSTSAANINRAFIDEKNKYYVTGHSDGMVKIWDLSKIQDSNTNQMIHTEKFSKYGISSISIDSTSEILAIGAGNRLFLYSIDYKYLLSRSKVPSPTRSIDFRPNHKNLLTSHHDRFIYWDYYINNKLKLYDKKKDIHGDYVSRVMYYPYNDLNLIISSGHDGSIKIFDIDNYDLKAELVCDKDNGWIIIGENGLFNGEGSIINKYKERAYTLDNNILKDLF
mgnify:FL=1